MKVGSLHPHLLTPFFFLFPTPIINLVNIFLPL
jgi:hypothetical protein